MGDHLPVRARILGAWTTDCELLTKHDILHRAKTTDVNEFRHLVDSDFIRHHGGYYSRTPAGADRQQQYENVRKLTYG